jgi:hypothetical protein
MPALNLLLSFTESRFQSSARILMEILVTEQILGKRLSCKLRDLVALLTMSIEDTHEAL